MSVAAPAGPGTSQLGRAAILAALAAAAAFGFLVMLVAAMSGRPAAAESSMAVYGVSQLALDDIPPNFLGLYQRAARKEGLDWAVLAGIGRVETNHQRSELPGVTEGANAYGCCGGPMQFYFMPSLQPAATGPRVRAWGRVRVGTDAPMTWGSYGVDGNGDGYKDVWDEEDAIPAAAAYLKASGGAGESGDYKAAVWAYNHSDAYYRDVMSWADKYRGDLETVVGGGAGASPADGLVVPTGGDKVAQLVSLMNRLDRARIPYCYGGGHGITPARPSGGQYCWNATGQKVYGGPSRGLDCSSSTSWLLQSLGYSLTTMTSGSFMSWGQPGPGKHVTIWTNSGHVYLEVKYQGKRLYFGTSTSNYRHGPGWHPARSPTGFVSRHPPGL